MTVLCYHSVEPDWESPLAVHPDDFARHCAWLARRRRVLPLADAIGHLDRSGRLPRGQAALTFDDGFAALHSQLLPMLRQHRLPATVFLVAQTLTKAGQPVDWVDTPPGHPLVTLDLAQIQEMQAAGVAFESHSWAHHDLTRLDFAECVRDLRDSRELLADLLGRPVTLLAYPRGRHDTRVRQAAERAGFRAAFALPESAERPGPFAIPRVGVNRGNTVATLRVKCARAYLPVRTSGAFGRLRRLPRRPGPISGRRPR